MAGQHPEEVETGVKNTMEKIQPLQELDEEKRSMLFKMSDPMLTKKKFKDLFNKNVATL
jgi:hypothetical protein